VSAQDRESSKSSHPEAVVLVNVAVVVTSSPMVAISGILNSAETWTDVPMLEDAAENESHHEQQIMRGLLTCHAPVCCIRIALHDSAGTPPKYPQTATT
jgi:hypothetical protein